MSYQMPIKSDWFADRFNDRAGRVRFDCVVCGRAMWFPQSKHGKYQTCGPTCAQERREKLRLARRRECETCGAAFFPRQRQLASGQGMYCSQKCNVAARSSLMHPLVRSRARDTWVANHRANPIVKAGPANPKLTGGVVATRARRMESGKARAQAREWYARNKDKAIDKATRRRQLTSASLPKGTIARLERLQRMRCAVCKASLSGGYHVDHIVALARGGSHEPSNLQLLCSRCNCRKSSKEAVEFMQQNGYLL